MPDDHRPLEELDIADLRHVAAEYRTLAETALTTADRDSHTRVADGFERIVERRRQALPRREKLPHAEGIHDWQLVRRR